MSSEGDEEAPREGKKTHAGVYVRIVISLRQPIINFLRCIRCETRMGRKCVPHATHIIIITRPHDTQRRDDDDDDEIIVNRNRPFFFLLYLPLKCILYAPKRYSLSLSLFLPRSSIDDGGGGGDVYRTIRPARRRGENRTPEEGEEIPNVFIISIMETGYYILASHLAKRREDGRIKVLHLKPQNPLFFYTNNMCKV